SSVPRACIHSMLRFERQLLIAYQCEPFMNGSDPAYRVQKKWSLRSVCVIYFDRFTVPCPRKKRGKCLGCSTKWAGNDAVTDSITTARSATENGLSRFM